MALCFQALISFSTLAAERKYLENLLVKQGRDLRNVRIKRSMDDMLFKMIKKVYAKEYKSAQGKRNKNRVLYRRSIEIICLNLDKVKGWYSVPPYTNIKFISNKTNNRYYCKNKREAQKIFKQYLLAKKQHKPKKTTKKSETRKLKKHLLSIFGGYRYVTYEDFISNSTAALLDIDVLSAGVIHNFTLNRKWRSYEVLELGQGMPRQKTESFGVNYLLGAGVKYTNSRTFWPYLGIEMDHYSVLSVNKNSTYTTTSAVKSALQAVTFNFINVLLGIDYNTRLFTKSTTFGLLLSQSISGDAKSKTGGYTKSITKTKYELNLKMDLTRKIWAAPFASYATVEDFYSNIYMEAGFRIGYLIF